MSYFVLVIIAGIPGAYTPASPVVIEFGSEQVCQQAAKMAMEHQSDRWNVGVSKAFCLDRRNTK